MGPLPSAPSESTVLIPNAHDFTAVNKSQTWNLCFIVLEQSFLILLKFNLVDTQCITE